MALTTAYGVLCAVGGSTNCSTVGAGGAEVSGEAWCQWGLVGHYVNCSFVPTSTPTKPWVHWQAAPGSTGYNQTNVACSVSCGHASHGCSIHVNTPGAGGPATYTSTEQNATPNGDPCSQ